MYVRTSHQPQSADDVIQVIKANVFATMVTFSADGPIASHLPFMIDKERGLIQNVVSFEIPISRIEGKFKLNQGEKPERTRAAITELEARGAEALARYMRRYNNL